MKILIVGNTLHTPLIRRAAENAGIEAVFISSKHLRTTHIASHFDVLLAGSDHGDHLVLAEHSLLKQCDMVIPLSGENISAGISTLSTENTAKLNEYFAYGGPQNLSNGFAYIGCLLHQLDTNHLPEPEQIPLDAVYDANGHLFHSAAAYLQTQQHRYSRYIGMLSYRSRWADGDISVEQAIVESLHRRGIGVICAYSDGSPNAALGTMSFQQAVEQFFCIDGRPIIDLLINFQFFGTKAGNGQDMFHKAVDFYSWLDIPVIRPTGLSRTTIAQWETSTHPYASDLSTNFIVPELQGMIEPIHLSCYADDRIRDLIPERIERLTGRITNWIKLRRTSNADKHIAIILHNAPCSGVEATVGQATDLDAFQSTVNILQRLSHEGYAVTGIPEDGKTLKQMIFDRKAYSDFRWTSAEDISESGGVLYRMDTAQYLSRFQELSAEAQDQMNKSWSSPPGEAMVLDNQLLITGICFGNVLVMVQPKRGCYGAKCTGEVCKILQDPTCPPTHQYLATYWYLQDVWNADAVIHLGTHGSLEYLPGKANGLGPNCFPDIALGNLINLYPYNAAITPQAMIAKRRSNAVAISYLPSPGKGLDTAQKQLLEMIGRYFSAKELQNGQDMLIRQEIETAAAGSVAAQSVFSREPDFDSALLELRVLLRRANSGRKAGAARAFGSVPDSGWIQDYILELWCSEAAICNCFADRDEMEKLVARSLNESEYSDPETQVFIDDAKELASLLQTSTQEMDSLIHGLSGGYIPSSQGGEASCSGRDILPTGRNLHNGQTDKIPTQSAYQRGIQAADGLIQRYQHDSGIFPEKVAMNMTSLDVTRTGGEQIAQFLALMGIRPVWSPSGIVEGLAVIPLTELGRPRIDVTAHISSVMRDAWPDMLTLLDRAVRLAASQEEPEDQNLVRANTQCMEKDCADATGRIFGGQPGTYTSAVGLALRASAWKNEDDLAKYFIDSSSYLYGENKQGIRDVNAFAANIRQVDLTCDITASRRTDGIASSYSSRIQGGFRLAAKALGSRKQIHHYMGKSSSGAAVQIQSLSEHITEAIQDTLLNDVWREQMMSQGYQGAADIMGRMQNIFDIQCVCENLSDDLLDQVASVYLLDDSMCQWFHQNNPYALEESSRRFLEMNTRGKWNGESEILQKLRLCYLRAEGELEDSISGLGEVQAGNVDIITHNDLDSWSYSLQKTEEVMKRWQK